MLTGAEGGSRLMKARRLNSPSPGASPVVQAVEQVVVVDGVERTVVQLHARHDRGVEPDERHQACAVEHVPRVDAEPDVRSGGAIDELGRCRGVRHVGERQELERQRAPEGRDPVGEPGEPCTGLGAVDVALERGHHLQPVGAVGGDEVHEGVELRVGEQSAIRN